MRLRQLTIALFAIILPITTIAQDELFFSKLDKSKGISYSTVRDICQDSKGNIWLGTEIGLNKYDGFKVSQYFVGGSGLESNEICKVSQYYDDVAIGTADGLYIYDHAKEMIRPLYFEGEKIGYVESICVSDDEIFVASRNGIFRYSNGQLSRINNNKDIVSINLDSSGNLICASEQSIIKFSRAGKELSSFMVQGLTIVSMHVDNRGSIWIGTRTNGVFEYMDEARVLSPITPEGLDSKEMIYVRTLETDKKGNLWVGTENGLFIYNTTSHKCVNYKKNYLTPAKGISSNPVYALFNSKDEVMWIGTFFDGVDYTDISSTGMKFIIPDDGKTTTKGHAIRSFMEDAAGNVWFATEDGGISIYDTSTGQYKYLNKTTSPALKGDNVHTIVQDHNGTVWAANYLDGLHKISSDLKHVENVPTPKSDPRIMVESSPGTLMIGFVNGLYTYSIQDGKFEEFMPEYFKEKYINYLMKDTHGNLWIAADNSRLYKYQLGKNHQIVSFVFPYRVTCGTISGDDELWFSTFDSKIVRFHEGETSEYLINFKNEYNSIQSIVSDQLGRLWMGTLYGIASYNPESNEMQHYSISDGLISNQFSGTGAMKTRSDRIYLATIRGACSFTAEIMNEKNMMSDIPVLSFSNFKLLNSNRNPISESIDMLSGITLKHKDNSVSFDITPIMIKSGIIPVHTMEFMLEGVDKTYISSDAKQINAIYRNIPSGTHRFHVKITDPLGRTMTERELYIDVKVPFFFSTAMVSVYLVLLLLMATAIYQWVKKKSNQKMEMNLSDQRKRMFTYLAHEIKNPLSVVTAVMEDDKEITENDKSLVSRNLNRMEFLLKQIMDYSALESGKMKVNNTKGDLVQFLHVCFDSFLPLLNQNEQHGVFTSSQESIECFFDSDIMEKIYCNLLSNAIKHSSRGSEILSEINISGDGNISISVFNSGSFIPEDRISQITQPFFKARGKNNSGIGMALVKDFVQMLNGALEISSSKDIGTRFTATLPFTQDPSVKETVIADYKTSNDILENTYYEISGNNGSYDSSNIKNGRYTILLADDNVDFNNLIASKLRAKYNIIQVFDGKEAIEHLDNTVDIVISDIQMPEADGYEVCERVKRNRVLAHIPVILLTSDHSEPGKIEGLNRGADLYMEKPVSLRELDIQIKNLIESKEKVKQYYQEKVKFDTMEKLSNKEEKFIADLTKYVRENISNQDLNVGSLAEYAKISRTQIYNKLKASINMSAAEFINKIRMDMAVEKLFQTDLSVSEISWELGFSSPSYFVKIFKKQYGTTPKEYRNVNGRVPESDQ